MVGSGWRAEFFARLARALPESFELVGVTSRRPESVERVATAWGTQGYATVADLLAGASPQVTVVSTPWPVTPVATAEVARAGGVALAETPPAPDLDGLHTLWEEVGATGRVHVAEQYLSLPMHAARLAVVERGLVGEPQSVHVSSTHGYHAVAMIRGLLGAADDHGPVTVRAHRFGGRIVQPLTRDGWSDDDSVHDAGTVLATLDLDGRHGLYDFTDNQWHNQLRSRRVLVRGTHGEISNDDVLRLSGPRQVTTTTLRRRQLGYDLDLDGYDTDHVSLGGEVLWSNPFIGKRFMDEEIAIATLMLGAADLARDEGPGPYPLARACHDHAVSLAIDEAVETDRPVTVARQPWS
ncbi:Gfo/Idh/MocA family oxidoreductase [Sanguibacter sp. HDW7]|nr:Gfo/Idh/MocA family oxidoreductase [Sanguibacter sp. HDW7]